MEVEVFITCGSGKTYVEICPESGEIQPGSAGHPQL